MRTPRLLSSLAFRLTAAFALLLAVAATSLGVLVHSAVRADLEAIHRDAAERSPLPVEDRAAAEEMVRARLAAARAHTTRIVLLTVLAGTLAAAVLVGSFLRPVTRLIRWTRALGRGEFEAIPTTLPRRGELGALADALARTARALRDMRAQLVAANDGLERKVRDRTAALEAALADLQVVDRMKDEFLSSMSHELRTPLTSIRAAAEILLRFPDEAPATRREFLEMVLQESERLARLVGDVLDLAQLEAGDLPEAQEPVDLFALVEEALRDLRPQLEARRVTAAILRHEPLPLVRADRARILQVVSHLLGNAVKFSPPGGRIEASARAQDGCVAVCVADQGSGIPPHEQVRIFDRFRQLGDTLTAKPAGAGLGLPISRSIVERHGGRLWVESRPGQGSRFYFTLPTAAAEAIAAPRGILAPSA